MKNNRLIIYFKKEPVGDSYFPGDRLVLPLIKKLLKRTRTSSLESVFINLCKGLDALHIPYLKNLPFNKIRPTDRIVVLGMGKNSLKGYNNSNKLVAGIGLMTHPANWPSLFKDFKVAIYLQHSTWTKNIYNKWFGPNTCTTWPVGIDTDFWTSKKQKPKKYILVYVKFLWNREQNQETLFKPIIDFLVTKELAYQVITYGSYTVKEYKELLEQSSAMIFLCEHESQGLAYQEAMSMNVPIYAWDQGLWLDENRFEWSETAPVPASSVPYFDQTCGKKFKDLKAFYIGFDGFYDAIHQGKFTPRAYVLASLTLKKSAQRMLEILDNVYNTDEEELK